MSRAFKSVSPCLRILPVLLLLAVSASAADPVLSLADSLKSAGFYNDAVTEYRRYLFFNPFDSNNSDIHAALCYCYVELGDKKAAFRAMGRAVKYAANDSVKIHRRLDRAVIAIAMDDLDFAERELTTLAIDTNRDLVNRRAGVLLFLTYVFKNDWKASRQVRNLLTADGYVFSDSLVYILDEACRSRRKSPAKAALLSTLIPGLGQVYNGQWLTGLHALALNAAMGYLTVSLVIDEAYVSSFLSFVFLFQRYYEGNRQYAFKGVEEHNLQKDIYYRQLILMFIESSP